jgi:hypothetical protein
MLPIARAWQMMMGCLPRSRMRRHSFSIGEWKPLTTVTPSSRIRRAASWARRMASPGVREEQKSCRQTVVPPGRRPAALPALKHPAARSGVLASAGSQALSSPPLALADRVATMPARRPSRRTNVAMVQKINLFRDQSGAHHLHYVPATAGVVSKISFPASKLGARLDRCRISTLTT